MKTFKILSGVFTLIFILTFNTECAKTDDVEPIVINSNSDNDSTNNDTTSVTVADDTVYISSSVSAIDFGFLLNEVLYDPSNNSLEGDANGNGEYVHNDDEFVEFVNTTSSCIDISGCKIFDDDSYASFTHKHQFPNNTFVNPNQAVVVFGGPQGATFDPSSFGNALVFTASDAVMNLTNNGDKMWFTDSSNQVLIEFDVTPLSNNPNESYTRNPDLTGDFEQHASAIAGVLFSPGTKIDGSPF